MNIVNIEWVPKVGKEFDSEDDAWNFWVIYAGKSGFSVRKHWKNVNREGYITSARYVCSKEGVRTKDKRDYEIKKPRAETRTGCLSRMGISRDSKTGKYRVEDFVAEHNHIIHLLECSHLLPSQRKITDAQAYEVELANDSGIGQKAAYELMSKQAGGRENLGFTKVDQKNYLRNTRKRDLEYGGAGSLLKYFQKKSLEDPTFYNAVQLDASEKIVNIFWADSRMLMDYDIFGDVVTFDTTYSTNKEYRPFGVFAGFNHHRGIVIFGAALLYEETVDSFVWLFRQFLEAHKEKKPKTIFTDQDAAMAKALSDVMPETRHGLCTWHIMQNGIKHHGNLMKGESPFMKDFMNLMYHYKDESKFEKEWLIMLSKYLIRDSGWLNGIYRVKEKWAKCYMKTAYTIGMRSTQVSESLNSDLKNYLKSNMDIGHFLKHFDRVVNEKRYNELKAEYHAREKKPRIKVKTVSILRQAAQIYTPFIFELFQEEWEKTFKVFVERRTQSDASLGYLVMTDDKEDGCIVTPDDYGQLVLCTCRKYERIGYFCCHVLKVFDIMDIKSIPENYISKRWSREAKFESLQELKSGNVESNVKLDVAERYRNLCRELIKLASRASNQLEDYVMVMESCQELHKQIDDNIRKKGNSNIVAEDDVVQTDQINKIFENVKGFKEKTGGRSGKRPKSWVETQPKNKKKKSTNTKVGEVARKNKSSKMEFNQPKEINMLKLHEDSLEENSKKSNEVLSNVKKECSQAKKIVKKRVPFLKDIDGDQEFLDDVMGSFDLNVRRYVIDRIENVAPDGQCGYRCCAELLGLSPEDGWITVRKRMLAELKEYKDLHMGMLGSQKEYDKIVNSLTWFSGYCKRKHWFQVPNMGSVFATAFNCVLCILSPEQYITYLPLRSGPPADIKFIQLGLYADCHFLKCFRKLNAPIPKIYPAWIFHCSDEAMLWANAVSELVSEWGVVVGKTLEALPPIENVLINLSNELTVDKASDLNSSLD